MPRLAGIWTCGKNNKKKINLKFALWKIRTLKDSGNTSKRRTSLAIKLDRYDVHIAALCDTRLLGNGSIHEPVVNYVLFWNVYSAGRKHLHGIGIVIRCQYTDLIITRSIGCNRIICY